MDEIPEVATDSSKTDVRAAIEWAWLNYDRCVVRDDNKIAIALDFDKADVASPPGGKQFLDYAFTNKVSFYNLVVKALGTDIEQEDEMASAERKSIDQLMKLLKRFEEAGKKKA